MRIHPPYLVIGIFGAAALLSSFVVMKVIDARRRAPPGAELAPKGIARLAPPAPPSAEQGFIAGRVRAEAGDLPSGLAVYAQHSGGAKDEPHRVDVAPNGLYRLAVPEGEYRVWAGPAGTADTRARPEFARVTRGETLTLDLRAPAPAGLSIAVLEPDGKPSAGAVVTLARPGDAKLALATAAGADGAVPVAREMGLAGAAVEVRAHNGGRTGSWSGALPEQGAVTVRLAPAAVVEGIVVARRGKAPAGFTLTVASQPAPQAWRTLAEHRFTGDRFAVPDLPPEPLRLTVRTDDGRTGTVEVSPAPGQTITVEIALSGG